MNIVIISSTIHTCNKAYTYTPTRSVFTPQQRLTQTIETINSIRKYIPSSYIILAENSRLSDEEIQQLPADKIYIFDSSESNRWRDCPYKGAAEAYVLLQVLDDLNDKNFNRLFKISGRYQINSNFKWNDHCIDKCVFVKSGSYPKSVSTTLYSIPKSCIHLYRNSLTNILQKYNAGPFSIEDEIAKGIPDENLVLLKQMGVQGRVACNGNLWSK